MPPKTKLFVGTLPPNCQESTLRQLFEENAGEVAECSIMGTYAFVHMKSEEEAAKAIKTLHQYSLDGVNISVEQSTGEKKSGRGGFRGGFRGNFRGGRGYYGGPMRDRPPYRDDGYDYRSTPYERPGYDYRQPHPADRYEHASGSYNNGYYDGYDRRPPAYGPRSRDPYYPPPQAAPHRELSYPTRVPSPGGGRPYSPPRYGTSHGY